MAAHDGAEPRIVLGGRHHCLRIIAGGEDGASLAVWQRVDRFGDTLGQRKVLKIVFNLIDRQGLGREDRVVVGRHRSALRRGCECVRPCGQLFLNYLLQHK